MLVKICGVTSESDALLAVALGADAVGFIFAPSPRQVSARAVQRIVDRLPHDTLTVGVFRNEAPARVVEVVNTIGLRAAQLHGNETAEDTRYVAARVPVTIKAFSAGHPGVAKVDDYGADWVMVDSEKPGSGVTFDWRLAEGVVDPARLIVSGGLDAGNVGEAISLLNPHGVDVCSGVEAEPGKKDPQKLRAFVAAARRAAELLERERDDGLDEEGRPFDWQEDG